MNEHDVKGRIEKNRYTVPDSAAACITKDWPHEVVFVI